MKPWHLLLPIPIVGILALIWIIIQTRNIEEVYVPLHITLRPDMYQTLHVDTLKLEHPAGVQENGEYPYLIKRILYRKRIGL